MKPNRQIDRKKDRYETKEQDRLTPRQIQEQGASSCFRFRFQNFEVQNLSKIEINIQKAKYDHDLGTLRYHGYPRGNEKS